jgi:serine/threonine-protein kinase 11
VRLLALSEGNFGSRDVSETHRLLKTAWTGSQKVRNDEQIGQLNLSFMSHFRAQSSAYLRVLGHPNASLTFSDIFPNSQEIYFLLCRKTKKSASVDRVFSEALRFNACSQNHFPSLMFGSAIPQVADPAAASPEHKTFKLVNGYALVKVLGVGTHSRVHLAISPESQIPFAVKVVHLHLTCNRVVFQHEVRLHRRLDHPAVVKLHDAFFSKRFQSGYLFFEWAPYGPLSNFVRHGLPEKTVASIYAQVSIGLAYLHSEGIVHHDIKPANILLFPGGIAKVGDLSISRTFASADSILGSPGYQAPEDFFDDQDAVVIDPVKEDVWSLGISIYETFFGKLPFEGETVYEVTHNIVNSPIEFSGVASDRLQSLLRGMLDVNPKTRFTLEQVRDHPFFKDAEPTFSLPFPPMPVPEFNKSFILRVIPVCFYDESTTFEDARKSTSWNGLFDRISMD